MGDSQPLPLLLGLVLLCWAILVFILCVLQMATFGNLDEVSTDKGGLKDYIRKHLCQPFNHVTNLKNTQTGTNGVDLQILLVNPHSKSPVAA